MLPLGMRNPLDELPIPTGCWSPRRKLAVVEAVRGGWISLQEACERYHLSIDEFLSWERAIARHGAPGLRVTRLKTYRDTEKQQP